MLNRRTFRNCCTTLAVALAAIAACAAGVQADLVAYWNFNSGVSGTPWTFPIASNLPSAAAGSITQGTWGSGLSSLDAFGGSTINAISPDGAGASLSLVNQSNNNKYIEFQFSMTGFSNLVLTFATRGTGTGFNNGLWSYSTDGVNFTQEPSNTNTAQTGTTFALKTVDFSAVTALNNAPTVYLRYTLSGASGASGNNRLDNVQLNATFNPSTGACCNGGSCSTLSQADCTIGGGTYQGDNAPCDPNPCTGALTGACCNATTGVCTITTSAACTGTYQGDNTVCSPNPCPQPPTGACCNNGVCSLATQFNCTSGGGTYTFDGSTCTVNACPCFTADSVRALPNLSNATVCSLRATSLEDMISSASFKSFQAQDTSGTLGVRGVTIFGPSAAVQTLVDQLSVGATFDVYGGTNVFNGLFEIEDTVANPLAIANVNFDTPATPYAITLADLQTGAANAEQLESVLVQTECVTFTSTGTFTSGQNYNITNGTLVGQVRISTSDLPIANTTIPTGPVRLTGILSQNDTTAPFDGGYQLLLRTPADLEVCSTVEPCNSCPGNFDGVNTRDGRDIRGFVNCFMSSFGNAPSAGCGCVDINGDEVVNLADLNDPTSGFIQVLLTGTACP